VVGVPVELQLHLHVRMRLVEPVDLRLQSLSFDIGVAVPHRDLDGRLLRTRRDGGPECGEGADETDDMSEPLHAQTTFLRSLFIIQCNTTERGRWRGLSGSSERACASATAVRWTRTSSASGCRPPTTTEAPAASTSRMRSSSTSPNVHTIVPEAASAIGPCRYSSAG